LQIKQQWDWIKSYHNLWTVLSLQRFLKRMLLFWQTWIIPYTNKITLIISLISGNICLSWLNNVGNLEIDQNRSVLVKHRIRNSPINLSNKLVMVPLVQAPPWSWSYGSWIYNYLCNQCLSPLKLWVRTLFVARCTRYNIMWESWKVVSDLRQVCAFLWELRFPRTPWYNLNIVEIGVKHHKRNQPTL
jgi:hypothetical protein